MGYAAGFRLRLGKGGGACALVAGLLLAASARATTVYVESTSSTVPMDITSTTSFWTTEPSWTAVNGLNDADNGGTEEFDFVGDITNPGFYWARDASFVYLRIRVDSGTYTQANYDGVIWAYINVSGGNTPDYAIAWDSAATPVTAHGLEMQIFGSSGAQWNDLTMNDLDGANAARGTADINGLISGSTYRTGEGYVRLTDGQATTNFGTTTFVDFAVSWSYLATYAPSLTTAGTWSIQLGSTDNRNDHNFIDVDVGGGLSPTSAFSSSGFVPVPEPRLLGLALCALGLLAGQRSRRLSA